MTTRRTFLFQMALALPGVHWLNSDYDCIVPVDDRAGTKDYLSLSIRGTPNKLPIPDGKRIPFGWNYFTIPTSPDSIELQIPTLKKDFKGKLFLRLMVAMDTRDQREVSVVLAKSGKTIGKLPIWYASALQLFECELHTDVVKLMEEGIRLTLKEENEPVYLVSSSELTGSHLHVANPGKALPSSTAFLNTFYGMRSLHPFGWMEGCTLDGLQELSRSGRFPQAKTALEQRLALFIPDDQNLVYENPNTQPSDNQFNNLEAGLPFVAVIEKYPTHPSIKLFTDFCENRVENGKSRSVDFTTEGCYTLAYPLAAVAKISGNKDWYDLALFELEERIRYLTDDKAVYQRASTDGTMKGFRNWGRSYTWFLLGLARTTAILRQDPSFGKDLRLARIREAFQYYASLALEHQQPDHSWRAYLDLPETGYDASATAGLGASLLYGKRLGWLPDLPDSKLYAIRQRLEQSLTPDGFLANNCQINRGGEELQKSPYRVISQYVMGLMAHLYAHLK